MKEQKIFETLKQICKQSRIEDLQCEEDRSNIIPEEKNRIGMFFILDGILYHGESFGRLDYCPIGRTETLKNILYRSFEDEGIIEFCFEFPEYRFIAEHQEYQTDVLHLHYNDGEISDIKEIRRIVMQYLEEN